MIDFFPQHAYSTGLRNLMPQRREVNRKVRKIMSFYGLRIGAFLLAVPVLVVSAHMPGASLKAAEPGDDQAIEEITVIGSRHKTDNTRTIAPVDVLEADTLTRLADSDMDNIISRLVPSYNVNQQSLDDESTFVRPANLRALPADATLIFVNGKRRHKSAVITFLGGGLSDGSHAPDLASIPSIALQRVEVLLDGASAQYGSDAVAGVINFVLKNSDSGGQFLARHGEYKAGDGQKTTLAYNIGLPLGATGALNLSAETYRQKSSVRAVQRDDAKALLAAGNTHVAQPYVQPAWGQPDISDDYKFLANAEYELNNGHEVYGFANLAQRTVNGGFFYRNPHTRSRVFKGPVDDNGTADDASDDVPTILVVSLDGSDGCSHIPIVNNVPDATALAAVQASDNCYSFYETFPGGFTPNFAGEVEDMALAFGLRGTLYDDWDYDLGLSYGNHKITYFLQNTINPQLAHEYAAGRLITDFNPGAHEEKDLTVTLDIAGALDGFAWPVSLAYGLEYRNEEYVIVAGGENSWLVYEDANGVNALAEQGLGVGSNGYVGFPDSIAGSFERSNYAAYVDFGIEPRDDLLAEFALRYEDYEDFGDTLDVKLSARWQATDSLALRGSVGTGFRAPSAGQANTRKVTTEFSQGSLQDTATLPPADRVARQKGAKTLEPEEAVHVSLGAVHEDDKNNASLSVDLFRINLDNRITSSSNLVLTDADRAVLGSAAARYSNVRFFINDFETTTEGMDIKYARAADMWGGVTYWTANLNYTKSTIEEYNPALLNDVDRRLIEESLPEWRFNVEANHQVGDWFLTGRLRYYDSFYNNNPESPGAGFIAGEKWLFDTEVGYEVRDGMLLTFGAENVFDVYPDKTPTAGDIGDKYAVDSPFGFNGAFYYMRLDWSF